MLRRTLAFWPLNDVVRQLVYCENGSSVDRVYIDGRVVVRDGQVTGLETARVLSAIGELADRLHRVLPTAAAAAERWRPHLLAMHHRVAQTFELGD
jgi:hypothetical protein